MRYPVTLLLGIIFAAAQSNAQSASIYSTKNGAIDGYDAVSFFSEGKPVKGKKEFEYQWQNASWYFSSQQNLDSFRINPDKFAPQYGGYCAYGCADGEGHKAPTQVETWTIAKGKLYFNYNLKVKTVWQKNQDSFIKVADENWKTLGERQ